MRVVVFTGLPGTGKSTLADRLGRLTATPVFAGDWLLGALAPHGVLTGLPRETLVAVYRSLLESLVTRQLMLGQDAVVDGVLTDADAENWQLLTKAYAAQLLVIESICSDEVEHRRRIEGRSRRIPGWHEIDWSHVERMRKERPTLTIPRLTVDAIRPLDDVFRTVRHYVERSRGTPESPS